ncbi:MAG TPA: lasso peptide biosynthesis B2 protein [Terriglobales bacterium]|nr:lasso peptide biosynthesis B2 protein [Terriglobales bacterium]
MQYASDRSPGLRGGAVDSGTHLLSSKRNQLGSYALPLRAYRVLIHFDRYLARGDFAALHQAVRTFPLAQVRIEPIDIDRICRAVDIACIWYWKEVLCLQRSAATTCLLRKCGAPAQMVLGVQHTPYRAHAWVETNGRVINDRPYMRDLYMVIDIC